MKKPSPSPSSSSAGTSSGGGVGGRHHQDAKFKGVRRRKWGKWVSEVRLPNSRDRIWLGSYDSPEKAARAFDAAAFCLRGRRAGLNFPDDVPDIPCGRSLTHQQIQAAAARHAHSYPPAAAPAAYAEPPSAAASPSSSDGLAVAEDLTAMDWSFLDLMTDTTVDFGYNFFQPTSANDHMAAHEDGGTNLSLWNF